VSGPCERPLALRLREAVKDAHAEVQREPFLVRLFRSEISRASYGRYLSLLHPVYLELEAGLARHCGHPALSSLQVPWVWRQKRLEADLAHLHAVPAEPGSLGLSRRIAEVAHTAPHLLAAHFYVRYFGDLSGGQMLSDIVGPALGLTAEHGLSFYCFECPGSTDDAKASFKALINGLPLTDAEAQAILDEAAQAFRLHHEVFERLEVIG